MTSGPAIVLKFVKDASIEGRLDLGGSLRGDAFNVDYFAVPDMETCETDEALSFSITLLHRVQPLGAVTQINLATRATTSPSSSRKHGI